MCERTEEEEEDGVAMELATFRARSAFARDRFN